MYNMLTIDQLLITLTSSTDPVIEELIQSRDARVLRSMTTAAQSQKFITENQGNLLSKIIKENISKLTIIAPNIDSVLEANNWSRPFRIIDKFKKFHISTIDGMEYLDAEFSFSSPIRKALSGKVGEVVNLIQLQSGKLYRADLTEKNIVILTELLTKLGFDIDSKIKEYYDTITSWNKAEITDKYKISSIVNTNFQKQITQDLGINTEIDQNIINDRSHRYQYFVQREPGPYTSLVEQIANRPQPKIWIDSNAHTLSEVVNALVQLKRLPVMFVFDAWDAQRCVDELNSLTTCLSNNNLTERVGIYFRLNNDDVGKQFNKQISDCHFNYELNDTTQVVGIQSGKIPKFLLTTNWKPMSVVSIGNSLKQSKTAVYSNNCDLIVQYTDNKPIFETKVVWE